jgi:pilus assembly protein CpaC
VTFNGFVIPAIATRRTESDVELGDGQSFAVSGLLDNRDTESFSKLPFLSSIPVLGNLFKSKNVNKSRTELVLLVTPQVTMPLGPNDPKPEVAFPKDFLVHLSQADIQAAKDKSSKKN